VERFELATSKSGTNLRGVIDQWYRRLEKVNAIAVAANGRDAGVRQQGAKSDVRLELIEKLVDLLGRADDFRMILEGSPKVLKALADGLSDLHTGFHFAQPAHQPKLELRESPEKAPRKTVGST
jgi:hypothetical protein